HDAHTAILMGVAEVLAANKDKLPGTVKFIFQPAEEGAPEGEQGGATLMIEEGVLSGPDAPEAIFALHVWPREPSQIFVRPEGIMAASDRLYITIQGRQTHGSQPWRGIDPITVAAQVITSLQMITSRQIDVTRAPAVISIGSIHAGNRDNIIPDDVKMEGTIRTFEADMREDILARVKRTVENVAEGAGTTAEVRTVSYAPVTFNDPSLTERMHPTLRWAAGEDRVQTLQPVPGAEDYAHYVKRIPGMYFFLGVNQEGVDQYTAAPNHSPLFYVNEDALIVGVRALAGLAVDYLGGN
ncbi:MAG: amidohydrolase, partial [Gammaproteobacteria bacterium]